MNLKKFEMEEAGVLHLKDAGDALMYVDDSDGKPDESKPIRVHVWGPGSKQYAKAKNAQENSQVDLLKAKGKTTETVEEATLKKARFLAAITKGWENVDSEDGAVGEDLSMEIYTNPRLLFVRDQVAAFTAETANFSPGSSRP
jgi:hypothetical protein